MVPACAPTFPREEIPGAVKTICKKEYGMDVEATVLGSTIGIYYPMQGLLDAGLGISKEAWDNISNLLLIASRVVLSTDASINFYCVITQDPRLPELQVVIIKYVEDVKRGMVRNISREESFKRTLFSININPQAQKERAIEKVFDKLEVTDETRQNVLDEFFRSPPTKISDVGYWKGRFFLKDITMEEFLASQISNRIKIDFRSNEGLAKLFDYKTSESLYMSDGSTRSFLVKFKIADQKTGTPGESMPEKKIEEIIRVANEVLYGYKFRDFDYLILEDQLNNARLIVTGRNVYDFDKNHMPIEDIVQAPAGYFQ